MKRLILIFSAMLGAIGANAEMAWNGNQLLAPDGYGHTWSLDGEILDGCDSRMLVAMADGIYRVCYTNADGQTQTRTKKVKRGNGRQPVRMFLIGDSTVADYTLEKDYDEKRYPLAGWGQVFQSFMVADSLKKLAGQIKADSVVVYDKARGGRSTRTFFQEGRWREVYDQLRPGDWVLVQFGHNDAAVDKTERYVPIEGYKEFLRLFVSQTVEKGGFPVLVTPVARNYPWKEGRLLNVHGDYPDAVKAVAEEMNVPLIDLNKLSMDFFSMQGQEVVAEKYFMNFGPGIYAAYPEGQKDNTHFNGTGANAVAQLVFDALQKIKPELGKGHR
ncbi:MAG: rhamnogalacturonan acetylesterase [Breznakibacter sp.]